MKKGIMKKGILLLAMLLLAALMLAACKDPISGLTEGSSEEVVQLADTNPLPENGVVTAAQFRSIEGQDKIVTFEGSTVSGRAHHRAAAHYYAAGKMGCRRSCFLQAEQRSAGKNEQCDL